MTSQKGTYFRKELDGGAHFDAAPPGEMREAVLEPGKGPAPVGHGGKKTGSSGTEFVLLNEGKHNQLQKKKHFDLYFILISQKISIF